MKSVADTDSTKDCEFFDDKEQRRLRRKIDLRIMPLVILFFICSFLDRINIGNAKIAGLTEDLGMSESNYSIALSIFFAGYILAELPSNMILHRVGPRIWISIIMITWGIITASMGAVKNGAGLIAARLFLGVAEAGLVPAVLLYLSVWYTRTEISKRVAIFLASATAAGAYGIMHMDGYRGLHSWQWIFILEAIPPIFMGIVCFVALPDFPERTTFLSDRERELFFYRMKKDAIAHQNDIEEDSEQGFSWNPIIATFKDWKTYAFGLLCTCMLSNVYCVGMFLPSIVRDLGYTNPLVAQLMTVPPNAVASVFSFFTAFSADRYKERCLHTAVPSMIAVIGYALLIGLHGSNVIGLYITVVVVVCGVSASVPPTTALFSISFAGRSKRSAAVAIITSIGNIGGIVSGQLYRASDAPRYINGHIGSLVLMSVTAILAFVIRITLRRINCHRDKLSAEDRQTIITAENACRLGDKHPDFRYTF